MTRNMLDYSEQPRARQIQRLMTLTKAIRINPQDAAAYYNRGAAKGAIRRYQEAIDDFAPCNSPQSTT